MKPGAGSVSGSWRGIRYVSNAMPWPLRLTIAYALLKAELVSQSTIAKRSASHVTRAKLCGWTGGWGAPSNRPWWCGRCVG
jgi:hypothetical protein